MLGHFPQDLLPKGLRRGRRAGNAAREQCESLLCSLPWPGHNGTAGLQTLGVTSCARGEGVTTVAAQLAVAAAEMGNHRILFVDGNPCNPGAERVFCLPYGPGLTEALREEVDLLEAIQPGPAPNLSVLPAGEPSTAEAALFAPPAVSAVLKTLRAEFDLVVVDLPPVATGGATLRLAGLLDGVLLVVEADRVRWEVARRAKDILARSSVRLLGAVLNKRTQGLPRGWHGRS